MYNLTKEEKTLANAIFAMVKKSAILGHGGKLDLFKFYGSGMFVKLGIAEEYLSENFSTVSEALQFFTTCEEMVESIKSAQ